MAARRCWRAFDHRAPAIWIGHRHFAHCIILPNADNSRMGSSRPRPASGEFQCDMCGSLYSEALVRLPEGQRDEAICAVCQQVMNEWRGNVAPVYTLKARARYSLI